MKGLLKTTSFHKFMPVLACLFLAACGSGGGGDDFIDLGGGGGTDICAQTAAERTETKSIDTSEVSVVSKDGRATITVPAATNRPLNTLNIQVNCSTNPQMVGRIYLVVVDQSLGFNISISFDEADVVGIDRSRLQLGTLDTSNNIWTTVQGSGPDQIKANTFSGSIDTANSIFGIYLVEQGTITDNLPPDPPSNLRNTDSVNGNDRVILRWDPSPKDNGGGIVAGYRVYKNGAFIQVVSTTSLTYTDNFALNNIDCYQVSAFDNADPDNPNESDPIPSPRLCVSNP